MLRAALAFLLCFAAARAAGTDDTLTVTADVVDGAGTKLITGRGHAVLKDASMVLAADEFRYDVATGRATALGHVVFTRGARRLLADELEYRFRDGSFSARSVRLGQDPYYIEADVAEGTRQETTLRRARVSFGEPGPWQPTWSADLIVYGADGKLRSENSRVGLGSAQPVPLPHFQRRIGQPLEADVSFSGGFRRSLGLFADALALVPLNPSLRLGADVGLFTNRGLMAGPAGRYGDPENPERLRGGFRSGFINDHGNKETDLLGRPVPENRAYLEWDHRQELGEATRLTGVVNWWRDSEVLRDFRPQAFFPVQAPDSFLELVHAGPNLLLSAFTRVQPNAFHAVQQRLPELRLDLLPTPLGNGLYQRFQAGVARLREDALPTGPLAPATGRDLRSTRLDAYYLLERPLVPADWCAFTPVAGARLTHYAATAGAAQPGGTTRLVGEVGFDALLRTSGTFDYRHERWRIDGLRHLFTPRLSFRSLPGADHGQTRIPAIDRESFATYLPPLGLGDRRAVDDLRATNVLRVGFDNILQTRDAAAGTRDLLALNLANDFRYRRARGERDVSETHAELALRPLDWLQLDLYQSVAPQSFTLREFNSGLTLRSGQAWALRFGNNFLRGQLQDYQLDGRWRINESYTAVTRLHYDVRRHRFNEQAYGIAHNIGNTWLVSYTVSLYSGRRRESSFGFNVQVGTVRF